MFGHMESIVHYLYFNKEGTCLETLERVHIYTEATIDNQLNDRHTVCSNKISETINNKGRHQHNTPTLYPSNILILPSLSFPSAPRASLTCSILHLLTDIYNML
jgi:hypothetical protein